MKWNVDKIVSHAYGRLVDENKRLKELLVAERSAEIANRVDDAFKDAIKANGKQGDTCDCPVCTLRRAKQQAKEKGASVDAKFTEAEKLRDDLGAALVRENNLEAEVAELQKKNEDLKVSLVGKDASGPTLTARYQVAVADQIDRLWGTTARHNIKERAQRFLEEAVELVQSCGLGAQDIPPIVQWVYNRETGPVDREVGGTMVTLAALCARIAVNLPEAAVMELNRLMDKSPEEMRKRHNNKPSSIRTV